MKRLILLACVLLFACHMVPSVGDATVHDSGADVGVGDAGCQLVDASNQ